MLSLAVDGSGVVSGAVTFSGTSTVPSRPTVPVLDAGVTSSPPSTDAATVTGPAEPPKRRTVTEVATVCPGATPTDAGPERANAPSVRVRCTVERTPGCSVTGPRR